MMNLFDSLNQKTGWIKKNFFDYECTYLWTSIFVYTFVLFSLIVSIGMIFVGAITFLAINISVVDSDLTNWIHESIYLRPKKVLTIYDVAFIDLLLLAGGVMIGSTEKKFDRFLRRLNVVMTWYINKALLILWIIGKSIFIPVKVLAVGLYKISRVALERFCHKIVKE